MANPRKFSEKIALHNQKQAEETAAFEKIMREVSDATNKPDEENLAPQCSALNFNSFFQPEEATLANQYGIGGGGGGGGGGGRSGGTSPSRVPGQRGRASSSVGPMRTRPVERKHDTSPYGSTVYLSPPPDSSWRRTNSDSALHQSCGGGGEQQPPTSLSPHHPLHSHAHPHHNTLMSHRRAADIHIDTLVNMGVNANCRPRSSCEILRLPNNTNTYEAGGGGGGGNSGGGGGGTLSCGELQVPGGSLPDLTSVHFPQPYPMPHRTHHHYPHNQNHLSVPNSNNYVHHNKNMSPLDHNWIASSYQSHCSPPSQYSSTSNINIPSPTMVHSPGSPAESPQTDYSNIHQALLQPFEQITMLDQPTSNYNSTYINHSSPHSPQTTNSTHTYSQSPHRSSPGVTYSSRGPGHCRTESRERDPVPGGNGPAFPPLSALSPPPNSIPDIILTDYSGELEAGIFGGEEAQLRAGLDLDELTLLEEPSSLLPDSSVEHEFRLDRL